MMDDIHHVHVSKKKTRVKGTAWRKISSEQQIPLPDHHLPNHVKSNLKLSWGHTKLNRAAVP